MASQSVNRVNGGNCYACGQHGHLAKACPAKTRAAQKQKSRKTKVECFRCSKIGHIAKNCRTKCYICDKVGHLAKDCSAKCYNCGKMGHLAKKCLKKKAVSKEIRPPVIHVASNGQGLRTCDRVVKPGEVTRTGLII